MVTGHRDGDIRAYVQGIAMLGHDIWNIWAWGDKVWDAGCVRRQNLPKYCQKLISFLARAFDVFKAVTVSASNSEIMFFQKKI